MKNKNSLVEQTSMSIPWNPLGPTNPFNPETNISFELKQKSFITLKVLDLS